MVESAEARRKRRAADDAAREHDLLGPEHLARMRVRGWYYEWACACGWSVPIEPVTTTRWKA